MRCLVFTSESAGLQSPQTPTDSGGQGYPLHEQLFRIRIISLQVRWVCFGFHNDVYCGNIVETHLFFRKKCKHV